MTGSTPPAGEAMREAVARLLAEWFKLNDVGIARAYASCLLATNRPVGHEIARLTAERDEARADWTAQRDHNLETAASLREAEAAIADLLCDARDRDAALTTLRADHAAEVARREIVVDVVPMQTSRGPDFFVRITCGGRSQTPHVFRERFKAEYEAAHLQWVLGLRPDEPDVMAYDEASHPNAALATTETTDA